MYYYIGFCLLKRVHVPGSELYSISQSHPVSVSTARKVFMEPRFETQSGDEGLLAMVYGWYATSGTV